MIKNHKKNTYKSSVWWGNWQWPEVKESQYTPEDEFIEEEEEEEEKPKEQKEQASKQKNKLFDYLNKDTDAKRNNR